MHMGFGRIIKLKGLTPYILFALLMGCATTGPHADKALLDFLEDRKTSKEAVILKLGQPSGTFEGERILTYRIGGDAGKGYFTLDVALGIQWYGSKFSLVLIFDESGVLARHALVPVR